MEAGAGAREARLIVFAKAPVPGTVKTRLVPPLTPEQAAAVHEASLLDVVERARAVHDGVALRYDAQPGSQAFFAERFPDLKRQAQAAGDLGARMERAFEEELGRGAERVAIIGSDSPTLPAQELRRALAALAASDVVLGPAVDGGYYLLGLRRGAWPAARALFRAVPWSSERVLRETIRRVAGAGLGLELLAPWYDIDRIDDLRLAAVHAAPDSALGRLARGALAPALAEELTTWKRAAASGPPHPAPHPTRHA